MSIIFLCAIYDLVDDSDYRYTKLFTILYQLMFECVFFNFKNIGCGMGHGHIPCVPEWPEITV